MIAMNPKQKEWISEAIRLSSRKNIQSEAVRFVKTYKMSVSTAMYFAARHFLGTKCPRHKLVVSNNKALV